MPRGYGAASHMEDDAPAGGPLSLLGATVRRSIVMGRTYLILATALAVLIGSTLSLAGGGTAAAVLPLFLPVFTVQGSLGAMMVFSNDRTKGVLEYLMAYGVPPRRIFGNAIVASLALVSIVLAASVGAVLGELAFRGRGPSLTLIRLLLGYAIPMSYATVAFAATAGMVWASLSSPRTGINSPVGLLPILGIAPPLATLVAFAAVPADAGYVLAGALGLIGAGVLAMIAGVDRLMARERLLSPA